MKNTKNAKIIIATHKQYSMPQNELYLPLQVGASGKDSIGFKRDDEGENISNKNAEYCELTGLYYAWKNLKADYIGLVHYRRYFTGKLNFKVNGKTKKILSSEELAESLQNVDIILPKKRNYYIETLYSHYKHTMYVEPLEKTGEIIKNDYPEYFEEFEKLKKRKTAHMFNMFVMKKDKLDEYCTWLFEVLLKLEKVVDSSNYDSFHKRFYGRVSELLLDVWLNTKKYKYKEIAVKSMEKVNWFKKGFGFLRAKLFKKKYEKSF